MTASDESRNNDPRVPVRTRRLLSNTNAQYDGSSSDAGEEDEPRHARRTDENETLHTVHRRKDDQARDAQRQNTRDPPLTDEENQRVPSLGADVCVKFLWEERDGQNHVVTYYRMSDGTTWQQRYHHEIKTYLFQHVNADGSVNEVTARQPRCIRTRPEVSDE
jgi:hypothetical protein